MSEFWIADVEGVKARVLTQDARDQWVRVRGWVDAEPPTGLEFQWVRNAGHGGRGVMNHAAAELHEGLGWAPCGPPGYDDPAPAGAKPAKTAVSGDKKE